MTLCGFADDKSVKKQLEDLRNELISENEERLLDEESKRAEQKEQIQELKKRISDFEKREKQRIAAPPVVQRRQPTTANQTFYQSVSAIFPDQNPQQRTPSARIRARTSQDAANAKIKTQTQNDN